jgi:cytochrome c oxidase cbb3-type subunit III
MIPRRRIAGLVLTTVWGIMPIGCQREERAFRPQPPFTSAVRFEADYGGNAYALSEGKRWFSAFNCSGCHADGGGGIGPPLMDDKWVYGHEPTQIFDTIAHGRSNGMPAYGGSAREAGIKVVGTVPAHQIWQLVAYVRSLSGLASPNAAPGRDDHMQRKSPENSMDPQRPRMVPPPDAGDQPR